MADKTKSLGLTLVGSSLASSAIVALIAAIQNIAYAPLTFLFWLLFGFVANVAIAGTLGLMWHRFAYAQHRHGVHIYVLPGACVGLAISFLLFALPPILGGGAFDPTAAGFLFVISAAIGMALGGLTALFAWLIRRPDRDAPNPPTPAP